MINDTIKLAIVGFGNSAQAFARLLIQKVGEVKDTYGKEVLVTAIAGNRKGSIINHDGIDLSAVLETVQSQGVFDNPLAMSTFELIERSGADVVIELSPLSIESGQPAIDHIRTAFSNGMHVITANKGPIAWALKELSETAQKAGKHFLYETTVMDGAPVFNLVKHTLRGCKILSFEGILNTTTNFILEELGKGNGFDEAVLEAQRRGFAEADPTMDITGMDAAAKTCALINALMGGDLTPPMIETKGIQDITEADLQKASEKGCTIKLICEGRKYEKGARGAVLPKPIPLSHPFATVRGTSSALCIETDLMGKLTIIEHDPEIEQTAYGIFSDLLQLF